MRTARLTDGASLAAAAAVSVLFVLVAYRFSPMLALAAPVAAAGAALVLARPAVGICAGFLAIPLEGFAIGAGAAGLSPAEIVFLGTAASALLHLATGRAPLRAGAEHAWLATLIAVAATGLAFAQDPVVVVKIALMWSVFLVLSVYIAGASRRDVELVLTTLVVSGAILGAMALSGAGDIRLRAGGTAASNRATGAFNDPNLFAFYLTLVLPLALVDAVGRSGWRRVLGIGAAGLIFVALLLTLSRGAILGAAVAIGVLLVWRAFRRAAIVLLVVVAIFGAVNAEAILESRQVNVLSTRLQSIAAERDTNPRLRIYGRTPAMIADHPLVGVGLGNFPLVSPRYGMRERGGSVFLHAHNVPLTIAAETGLLGLAAFAGLLVALGRRIATVLAAPRSPLFPLGLALSAAIIGLGVISITDYAFRSNPITAVLLIELGILVAVARALVRARERPDGAATAQNGRW